MIEEHATADDYIKLARAIIALAATDLIAAKRPQAMREYVARWQYYQSPGNRPANLTPDRIKIWCDTERAQLLEFFANGGGELARAADCYHYVRLATRGKVTHKVLRSVSSKHKAQVRAKTRAQ